MSKLIELTIVTFIIHLIDTLAYAVRLNAVKSKQFALSSSLFNIFVLISRTANMFQGPLIGSLIGISIATGRDPVWDVRQVIFASTIGTARGTTQGSWRPFPSNMMGFPSLSTESCCC